MMKGRNGRNSNGKTSRMKRNSRRFHRDVIPFLVDAEDYLTSVLVWGK